MRLCHTVSAWPSVAPERESFPPPPSLLRLPRCLASDEAPDKCLGHPHGVSFATDLLRDTKEQSRAGSQAVFPVADHIERAGDGLLCPLRSLVRLRPSQSPCPDVWSGDPPALCSKAGRLESKARCPSPCPQRRVLTEVRLGLRPSHPLRQRVAQSPPGRPTSRKRQPRFGVSQRAASLSPTESASRRRQLRRVRALDTAPRARAGDLKTTPAARRTHLSLRGPAPAAGLGRTPSLAPTPVCPPRPRPARLIPEGPTTDVTLKPQRPASETADREPGGAQVRCGVTGTWLGWARLGRSAMKNTRALKAGSGADSRPPPGRMIAWEWSARPSSGT